MISKEREREEVSTESYQGVQTKTRGRGFLEKGNDNTICHHIYSNIYAVTNTFAISTVLCIQPAVCN